MIKINCSTKDTIKLTECIPFQGNLKSRTSQDIGDLKKSLVTEGLMMPFAVWLHEDKKYLLDGHGRKEALVQLAVDDASLLSVDWPCIFITADTEDDARKALLQITSSYGKITKLGVKQFTASIPDYVAPSIKKFVAPVTKKKEANINQDKQVIRVRVKKEKLDEFISILKTVDYVEVL